MLRHESDNDKFCSRPTWFVLHNCVRAWGPTSCSVVTGITRPKMEDGFDKFTQGVSQAPSFNFRFLLHVSPGEVLQVPAAS